MPIYVGNTEIQESTGNIQVGNVNVSEVYVGRDRVWRSGEEFTCEDAMITDCGVSSLGLPSCDIGNSTIESYDTGIRTARQTNIAANELTDITDRLLGLIPSSNFQLDSTGIAVIGGGTSDLIRTSGEAFPSFQEGATSVQIRFPDDATILNNFITTALDDINLLLVSDTGYLLITNAPARISVTTPIVVASDNGNEETFAFGNVGNTVDVYVVAATDNSLTDIATVTTVFPAVGEDTLRIFIANVRVPDTAEWSNADEIIQCLQTGTQESTIVPPTIGTPTTSGIGGTTVLASAQVTNTGGSDVISGVGRISESDSFIIGTDFPATITGTTLVTTFTGLDPLTDYYIRFQATNLAGTGTSPILMITTQEAALLPGDVVVSGSITESGDVTITTDGRASIYFIDDDEPADILQVPDQTDISVSGNSYTRTNVTPPSTSSNFVRQIWYGVLITDPDAGNTGTRLAVISSNFPQAYTPRISISLASAQNVTTTTAILRASVNDISTPGAPQDSVPATEADFYWIIDETTRDANYIIANGNNVDVTSDLINGFGNVTGDITYSSASTLRTLQYVFVAQPGNAITTVGSAQIPSTTVLPLTVTTNSATNLTATSVRLNGTVTPGTGGTILEAGFIFGTNETEVNRGVNARTGEPSGTGVSYEEDTKVTSSGGAFDVLIATNQSTTYYFRAAAQDAIAWDTGATESFTTPGVPASGSWSLTSTGTNFNEAGNDSCGSFSWTAPNDDTITFSGGNPVSVAAGASGPQTVTVTGTRSCTPVTNTLRRDSYSCSVPSDATTQSCPSNNPVNGLPTGINGQSNTVTVLISQSFGTAFTDTETLDVPNNQYVEPSNEGTIVFEWSGTIPSDGLSISDDVLSFIRNRGDATADIATMSNNISRNTATTTRTVMPSVNITYTVPNNFDNNGQDSMNFPFSATQAATSVVPEAPALTRLGRVDGDNVNDGGQVTLLPTDTTYSVTSPTFSGVPAPAITTNGNGSGSFNAPTSPDGRLHRWTATNASGSVTYSFTVFGGAL